jgi:hypothetical protein
MKRAVGAILVLLLLVGGAVLSAQGDEIVLRDGTTIRGTVTRVVPGESVEVLRMDSESGIAKLDRFRLESVAQIGIVDVSQLPATLLLNSGDTFRGYLIGSPLEPLIEFRGESGSLFSFDAEAVAEIRFSLRPPELAEQSAALRPGFGLGVSISSVSAGVTRDALAHFNEDWMLIAALGIHLTWEDASRLGIGVSSDLTYLRRFGSWYVGVGTGVFFNMTDVDWSPTLNARIVIPVHLGTWQTTLSIGYVFRL